MPDQTNAEVSDERLREIKDNADIIVKAYPQRLDMYLPADEVTAILGELLNRRSVTSQASEGAGWKLVPIRITPEMAHALESNIAECTEPSEVHQENWANAWHQAVLLAPEYSAASDGACCA